MRSIRTILTGVQLDRGEKGLTTGSHNALRQAGWLAREASAGLRVLHSTWEGSSGGLSSDGRDAIERALAELDLDTQVGIEVTATRSWLAMGRAAGLGEVQLVVVGKRDESSVEGRRLGHAASKLLRKCPVPVWAVRPEHDLVYKLILAATDLTAVGDRAVERAAWIAEKYGARLHVIHAYQVPDVQGASEDENAARSDELKARAQAHVDDLISGSAFDGESAVHLGRKDPYLAIREAVEHLQPDLLVMGSLSKRDPPGILVGETAERILGQVECSLLVQKPEDFRFPLML